MCMKLIYQSCIVSVQVVVVLYVCMVICISCNAMMWCSIGSTSEPGDCLIAKRAHIKIHVAVQCLCWMVRGGWQSLVWYVLMYHNDDVMNLQPCTYTINPYISCNSGKEWIVRVQAGAIVKRSWTSHSLVSLWLIGLLVYHHTYTHLIFKNGCRHVE